MGNSLCLLEPASPLVDPIDNRFAFLAQDDDAIRVYTISSSTSSTEVSNLSNPQENFCVKAPLFSRTLWEVTDNQGRDICYVKRKFFSFKSTVFVGQGGKRREFTIDKPGCMRDMYEVKCGEELILRVRDHLSSYNVEFFEVEKKCEPEQRASESSEVEVDLDENPAPQEEELGKMVAQVTSTMCSGVFLRAAPNVDVLLCGLVFLSIKAARNGQ